MTLDSVLSGARLQRIDAPSSDLFAFTLTKPGYKGVLLAAIGPKVRGMGLVAHRPHGAPASSFVQRLRKDLQGARLVQLRALANGFIVLRTNRSDGERQLVIDLRGGNLVLLDAQGRDLAKLKALPFAHERLASEPLDPSWPQSLEIFETIGASLLGGSVAYALETKRVAWDHAIKGARKRMLRKLEAIEGDAARASEAAALRARGQLLLSNLQAVARGSARARLQDFTQDPPGWIDIELDPALPPRSQAEAWFKRARRFERGAQLATQRQAITRTQLAQLDELHALVRIAASVAELDALAERARMLRVRVTQAEPGRPVPSPARRPYRELRGFADRPIYVGRGAKDNDELTLQHARPFDLWLHARDTAGAHVVVPLDRTEACPPELLRDAALLAAHFSDGRDEPSLDVIYVPRRYVRKPKGSAPGAVRMEREKVLRLQRDEQRLSELLASELPL